MKKRFLTILCLAAAFASCSTDDAGVIDGDSPKVVSVDPMIQTRATELNFEENDQIGLSIVMDDNSVYAENSMMTYNGSSFVGSLTWYNDAEATSSLVAYYPYADGAENPTSFTIQADQTADGAYTASDLMIATKSDVLPSSSATTMTFYHSLSRIVVEIDNQSEQEVESVTISNSYGTATLDLETQSVVVDEASAKLDIIAPLWDDETYKAIIVPQTAAVIVSIEMENGSVVDVEKAAVTFKAGAQYKAYATIAADGSIDVVLSGDIEDWAEGGTIPGVDNSDEVEFEEFDTYFVYDGETYNIVTLSDGSVWMAENLRYVPNGYKPSSDPTDFSGVWYPYYLDYAQALADNGGTLSAAALSTQYVMPDTSAESVKSNGYFYTFEAATGVNLNADTFDSFEPGIQGICPPGWHIPTAPEYFTLLGYGVASPYNTHNSSALFWETPTENASMGSNSYAHIQKANELGFNFAITGVMYATTYSYATTPVEGKYHPNTIYSGNSTITDWYGKPSLTYYMTSTPHVLYYDTYGNSSTPVKSAQIWSVMTTFTTTGYPCGRLSLSYGYASSGMPIRCVKDGSVTIDTTKFPELN